MFNLTVVNKCYVNFTLGWQDSKMLTFCLLGNFSLVFFCRLLNFFKINFFEKFFQKYHQSVKQFGSRSSPTHCRA